jgi:hypothetical protein
VKIITLGDDWLSEGRYRDIGVHSIHFDLICQTLHQEDAINIKKRYNNLIINYLTIKLNKKQEKQDKIPYHNDKVLSKGDL